MKNLLTKILFISLLVSVAVPSGVQAGFSVKKAIESLPVFLEKLGAEIPEEIVTIVSAVVPEVEELKIVKKIVMVPGTEKVAEAAYVVVAAAMGVKRGKLKVVGETLGKLKVAEGIVMTIAQMMEPGTEKVVGVVGAVGVILGVGAAHVAVAAAVMGVALGVEAASKGHKK